MAGGKYVSPALAEKLAFDLEGFVVEFVEFVEPSSRGGDLGGGRFVVLVSHGAQGLGGVVNADNIRPPSVELLAILLANGVVTNEAEEPNVPLCVADHPGVVADLQEQDVSLVNLMALGEQFHAVLLVEYEALAAALVAVAQLQEVFEGEIAAVGMLGVRPTVAVELQNAVIGIDAYADLDPLGAVGADDLANVLALGQRPAIQDGLDVFTAHGGRSTGD